MFAFLTIVLLALAPGERLDYDVRLGPVSVGRLELATLDPDTVRGDSGRRFRATIELALPLVFRARYVLDSWATPEELLTLRSGKKTVETRYRAQWRADYFDSLAVYSDGDTLSLEQAARDLLTAWQYLRTLPLATGDTARFFVHSDRRSQNVTVVARGHRTVETECGRFRVLELAQLGSGLVGTMLRSDDQRRLPVLIRTSITGVPVTAQLRAIGTGEEG
ncbi:MAG TPA: DUF3108 domain-containing protein [candidate division WOR-3 bacterium]|uniref:DUF3108 domain-containing protein n=1 Tax=candidate division WOR-3 bacterium TaxID=2052148 RepID=A0A7V0XGB4_UNCW3|nr:DUF3108 domain-containing protein [candidate division WOR-3 bacterium]